MPNLCPECEASLCRNCYLTTGKWDMPGACECECRESNVLLMPRLTCSWCGTLMRDGALPVTHGICLSCTSLYFPGILAVILLMPHFLLSL